MDDSRFFIIGVNGQLGTALRQLYPNAKSADVGELDITDKTSVSTFDWSNIDVILNAAAYTDVDGAETTKGREAAWLVNASAVQLLTEVAINHDITLVHISSDYVFDGTKEIHTEEERLTPLGVYAQSKAAGDVAVGLAPKHYLIRTSWVIGSGGNFVRSIYSLGKKGVRPNVVADQFGRLTFTDELVRSIDFLLKSNAPFGTYNVSNSGDVSSWSDIARQVYKDAGFTDLSVGDTTAEEYFAGKVSSPRPTYSTLDLTKITSLGYVARDWKENLQQYIKHDLEGENS